MIKKQIFENHKQNNQYMKKKLKQNTKAVYKTIK